MALKLRFWNIGVEGQMWLGCIAATGVALFDIGPDPVRLPLMFVAAAVAGACWIGIPAFLKLRFRVNEIITSLLLTYVAYQLVQHLLFGAWHDPGSAFPNSQHYDEGTERLARLGWGSSHTGVWIALGAGVLLWFVMTRARIGFYMDAIGANVDAARAAAMSGGLAAVAGAGLAAGQEYRMTLFIAGGYTFSGIVIAFIGRFRPIPVDRHGLRGGRRLHRRRHAQSVLSAARRDHDADRGGDPLEFRRGRVLQPLPRHLRGAGARLMAADFVQNWLATTPGFATPFLLAALGLMINERAGVLNLGCEGMMLVGAMTAAVVSFHTGLAGAGVPVVMLAGARWSAR